jgi:hypothetical protein
MPLQARVGRHANTGKHCQNWVQDQRVVITFLDDIPLADGGAGGALSIEGLRAGIAGDDLYEAILRFQKKHFPASPTGFIEPGGPQLAKLEALAQRAPPPPPRATGQWDNLKSGSVEKALRKALSGDLTIEHAEAIDIIRATLSNGYVSASELDDLTTIKATSKSISPRTKKLLENFVAKAKGLDGGKGPYRLPTDKHVFAANMTCDFLQKTRRTAFPKLDLDEVGVGMLMRIASPGLVQQGDASLCGPAVFMFNLLTDNPVQYARFAIDLFSTGKGKIGRLQIEPGKDVRNHSPGKIDQVDWLTMASLRDSENWFLDYDVSKDRIDMRISGMTPPGELAKWFRLAGFSDIRNETNLTNITHKGAATVNDANELWANGYRVCLFISGNMMAEDEQSSRGDITTRHWIVQRSRIDLSGGKAKLKVFSWGEGNYEIPHPNWQGKKRDLSDDEFLQNFYGYVAAKA